MSSVQLGEHFSERDSSNLKVFLPDYTGQAENNNYHDGEEASASNIDSLTYVSAQKSQYNASDHSSDSAAAEDIQSYPDM